MGEGRSGTEGREQVSGGGQLLKTAAGRAAEYVRIMGVPLRLGGSWDHLRFAVIDTESTGTDLRSDQIISIAGVAVHEGEIVLGDSFDAVVPVTHNTSSVMIHGITREASAERGVNLGEALGCFLEWLRDGVVVGHHIGHDMRLLSRDCERLFGLKLGNLSIDTMELYNALEAAGALEGVQRPQGFSLDGLCVAFGIVPHDRHTASGDAFLTAQIFIRLMKRARSLGWNSLEALTASRGEW